MDWGVVAFLVLANAVTCALLMVGGIWFILRRLSAQNANEVYQPAATHADATEMSERRQRREPVTDVPRAGVVAPKSASRRRGLKEYLAPIGGLAGSITDDQRAAVKHLFGKSAPTLWMSSAQAHAVLCARDYAEAVIDHRRGSRADFAGRDKIVRRLTLAIIADDLARDFVVDWAEGRYVGDDGTAPDPLEQDVWIWVQHHAARLMEAEGLYVEAA